MSILLIAAGVGFLVGGATGVAIAVIAVGVLSLIGQVAGGVAERKAVREQAEALRQQIAENPGEWAPAAEETS
jgi:hypothetical protein